MTRIALRTGRMWNVDWLEAFASLTIRKDENKDEDPRDGAAYSELHEL